MTTPDDGIVGIGVGIFSVLLLVVALLPPLLRELHAALSRDSSRCDCEVCQSPGETIALARDCSMSLTMAGRNVDADTMRALLHLLEEES